MFLFESENIGKDSVRQTDGTIFFFSGDLSRFRTIVRRATPDKKLRKPSHSFLCRKI